MRTGRLVGSVLLLVSTLAACSSEPGATGPGESPSGPSPSPSQLTCDIDESLIDDGGVGIGAIPALHDPTLVEAGGPGTDYLRTEDQAGTENIRVHDRVVVFRLDGEWVAVPHNILWWHEVVHFPAALTDFVVTYCPLTGSSLVFDYGDLPVSRFQVSGLLMSNNLMMRDPETGSLWPQMYRAAACGSERGTPLPVVPSIDTRWERWKALHPETRVVSSNTGFGRNYDRYPYNLYELPDSPPLFEVQDLDQRRPIKERVLGLPVDRGGVAYPFGELSTGSRTAVVRDTVAGEPVVVFWDERAVTGAAYEPRADGRELGFEVRDGSIVDLETGSTWRYDGFAVEGPLAGTRLEPVEEAYVSFWFAWAIFQPETEIWTRADASGEAP